MAAIKKKRKWWGYYRTPEERAAILTGFQSASEQEGLVKQGKLEKRGARVGDARNPRWVTLTQDELCYYYYDETTTSPGPVIDRIPIHEVEVRRRGLAWGCTCSRSCCQRQPAFGSLSVLLTHHFCSSAQRVVTEQEHAAQENARSGAVVTPESEDEHSDDAGCPAAGSRGVKRKHAMSRRDLLAQSSESAFLILTRGIDCGVGALLLLFASASTGTYG